MPSFAGLKSTVSVSPTLRVVFNQPARINWPGVRPSISHCTLPPLLSSTDRKIHTWGFVHFHSVIVPVSTTTLSRSNAELPWCARADVAVRSPAMTHEPILISDPPRRHHDISMSKSHARHCASCGASAAAAAPPDSEHRRARLLQASGWAMPCAMALNAPFGTDDVLRPNPRTWPNGRRDRSAIGHNAVRRRCRARRMWGSSLRVDVERPARSDYYQTQG